MSAEIFVIPWPQYSDDGRGPFWLFRVESERFRGTLPFAQHLGRFSDTNDVHRLAIADRSLLRQVRKMAAEFCAKCEQPREVEWHPV